MQVTGPPARFLALFRAFHTRPSFGSSDGLWSSGCSFCGLLGYASPMQRCASLCLAMQAPLITRPRRNWQAARISMAQRQSGNRHRRNLFCLCHPGPSSAVHPAQHAGRLSSISTLSIVGTKIASVRCSSRLAPPRWPLTVCPSGFGADQSSRRASCAIIYYIH